MYYLNYLPIWLLGAPATTKFKVLEDISFRVGLTTHSPSIIPIRTAPKIHQNTGSFVIKSLSFQDTIPVIASIPIFNCDSNKIHISTMVFKAHRTSYTLPNSLTGTLCVAQIHYFFHTSVIMLMLFSWVRLYFLQGNAYHLTLLRFSFYVEYFEKPSLTTWLQKTKPALLYHFFFYIFTIPL